MENLSIIKKLKKLLNLKEEQPIEFDLKKTDSLQEEVISLEKKLRKAKLELAYNKKCIAETGWILNKIKEQKNKIRLLELEKEQEKTILRQMEDIEFEINLYLKQVIFTNWGYEGITERAYMLINNIQKELIYPVENNKVQKYIDNYILS